MPGYDKARFLDLNKRESEQLECGICLAILRNPYITKCCGKAYCKNCIEVWLNQSQTCPNDRKYLQHNELMTAPLLVKNILNCLNINCQYKENGCDEVQLIEFIDKHEDKCKYNPEAICYDCLTKIGDYSDHNCITNLKTKLELSKKYNEDLNETNVKLLHNFNQENNNWNRKLSKFQGEITEIETERVNLTYKIKNLEEEMIINQLQIHDLKISLKESNDKCKDLKADYNKCYLANQDLIKDYNILKEESSREVNKVIADKSNIYLQIEKFETELSSSRDENKKLRTSLKESINYTENLKSQYEKHLQPNHALKDYNETLKIESSNQIIKSIKHYDEALFDGEVCIKQSAKIKHEKKLVNLKVSNDKIEMNDQDFNKYYLSKQDLINDYNVLKAESSKKIISLKDEITREKSAKFNIYIQMKDIESELSFTLEKNQKLKSSLTKSNNLLRDLETQYNRIGISLPNNIHQTFGEELCYQVYDAVEYEPGLSRPNKDEINVVEELIELIKFDKAIEYNYSSKIILKAVNVPGPNRRSKKKYYTSAFRLELQKSYSDMGYDIYAIKYGKYSFATVNMKLGEKFGVEKIKNAFLTSLKNTEIVWLKLEHSI